MVQERAQAADLSRIHNDDLVTELRRRGIAVVVFMPADLLQVFEELEAPVFDTSEWLEQHREAVEGIMRKSGVAFIARSICDGET